MKRYLPFLIIVLVAAMIGGFVFFSRSKNTVESVPFAGQITAPKTGPAPPNSPSPAASFSKPTNLPVGVAVTVEEYGDYQCPPCGHLYPDLKSIVQDYGNHVNFVFRNLPLTKMHSNALIAAKAAEAARLQRHFDEMHDRLYERQDEWKDESNPRPTFIRYAGELGLNTDRFDRDIDGAEVQQKLTDDQSHADSLGVQGTPTVFIEGREMKFELTNGEGIRKGIDLMLARKAAGQ